jgi:TolA-binding protein
MCYFDLQYFAQAIKSWEDLIALYPSLTIAAEAGFRAGDTYFKALEYDKARALFRWVVENHPSNDYARSSQLATAQSYYNEQNFDEAIREFQKFLDLFPASAEAANARRGMEMCYYRKGLESSDAHKYFDEGDYDSAIDEFVKVVVNFPSSSFATDALLLAAESAVNLESWQRAAELYERYLFYFPEGKERDGVYFNLGTSYFNLKDYGSALSNFEAVVEQFPGSAHAENALHNIAICKNLLGEEGAKPSSEEMKLESVEGEK